MFESVTKMVADYFYSLAHPTRIEILDLLRDKERMCVCEIVQQLKKDQSNVSRHLNALKAVGIVEFQAEGVRSFYKIKNKDIKKILDLTKSILRKEIRENRKVLAAF